MSSFEIQLNGEARHILSPNLTELIAELELSDKRFAVEVNRAIVPRDSIASVTLQPGDQVEIIHFVGGG